jgi:hypothetical protein
MTEKTEMTETSRGGRSPAPLRSLLYALSVFSVFSVPVLSAQTVRTSGRVLSADSIPVRGARVLLHRVGPNTQGPIDSTRSDRQARFHFAFRPDSGAFYVLSAEHAGIEYFSQPVPTNPARPATGIRILVYDTSSAAPVSLEARHIVVTRPAEDGSRGVLDLMVLRNGGRLTRIASDTAHPTWSAPLPPGTIGLELSESDFSREAVDRRNDSVIVVAPIAPGEKQLTVQYLIPSDRTVVELPFGARGTSINVLAEEKAVRVTGTGIAVADSQTLQGRSFRRWTGVAQPGGVVRIVLPGARRTPTWLLAILVGTLTLVFIGVGWWLVARRSPPGARNTAELIAALAALDVRYAGREGETPVDEWSSYLTERARIKAELEASLAVGGSSQ